MPPARLDKALREVMTESIWVNAAIGNCRVGWPQVESAPGLCREYCVSSAEALCCRDPAVRVDGLLGCKGSGGQNAVLAGIVVALLAIEPDVILHESTDFEILPSELRRGWDRRGKQRQRQHDGQVRLRVGPRVGRALVIAMADGRCCRQR
eukprot:1297923-Prymnesium_polylepis.1